MKFKVMTTIFAFALAKSNDHNLRPRLRRRLDSLPEHRSAFGIGVLRAKRRSPCDEGVLAEHGHARYLLHDHILEHPGDHGWHQGLL